MATTYIKDVQILTDCIGDEEPVDVCDLKKYLQVEGTAYDYILKIFISAARRKIENYCRISLVPKKILATFQTVGLSTMRLPFPYVNQIISVEWKKCPTTWEALTENDGYDFTNKDSWDSEINSSEIGFHRITYLTFNRNDDDLFRQAILMQAGYLFTHRDSPNVPDWNNQAKAMVEESRILSF